MYVTKIAKMWIKLSHTYAEIAYAEKTADNAAHKSFVK